MIAELLLNRRQHCLRRPSMSHKEVLDSRARAVLTQLGLLLEDAQHRLDDFEGFVLRDEGGNAHPDVRFSG